jgi:hypothetical protein
MRYMFVATLAVLSVLSFSRCTTDPTEGGALPSKEGRCLALSEPEGGVGLTTSSPSRVSLLFRVDTCAGEPVPGLDATSFDILEDGHLVSEFESQRRISTKGERYRLLSLVLLDVSGSMLRSGDFPQLKAAAAEYIRAVLKNSGEGHRVALMTFDGRETPETLVGFTDSEDALLSGLEKLSTTECRSNRDCAQFADRRSCAGWRCVDDSTNLNGAVITALDVLDAQLAQETVTWRDGALVLFTDGTDQAARVAQRAAIERANLAKTHIFTIGLGGEVDEGTLRALGRDGYWPVDRADRLAEVFARVADRVVGLANRFYLFEYCSPRRNGVHTLKIVAHQRRADGLTASGSLSRDFDATGFSSGCEL